VTGCSPFATAGGLLALTIADSTNLLDTGKLAEDLTRYVATV
jgi:hypothetical protein